ncbi:MAG: UDP-2,3-diacylglucosamine diphosphatase [Gammaproteobacteria bacterium]|nr:UDP-2,3-diacylglucosamine diphosphatase [Gammaproteobacteria bacterium]
MTTLFVSDIHLDAADPAISEQFFSFLENEAPTARRLYILGDLFESWIGDDDPTPLAKPLAERLRALSNKKTDVYFMHGNRDFLLGETYAKSCGMTILNDPVVQEIEGQSVLLSHGDQYCTDDKAYQTMRAQLRDPKWQQELLAQSIDERLALAESARQQSQAYTQSHQHNQQSNGSDIMDVNQTAIEAALANTEVDLLLHGHTHRPAIHRWAHHDRSLTRIVLGAWHHHGSVLYWRNNRFDLRTLPRQ